MNYLIGMGNYSMGDDGIGLRITEHISDKMLDDGFEAIEVANNGMQLLTYFEDNTEKLLIVDAVKFGGEPGDHILFSPEDVKTQKVVGTVSTHEGDILKLITMAEELELPMPEIRILGIEPESMTPDAELSAPLQAGFNNYIEAVLSELKD